VLSVVSRECQEQPAGVRSPKSSSIPLLGVEFFKTFFPRNLASSGKADAFSYAEFIKPSRPHVRASILVAKGEQGGTRP